MKTRIILSLIGLYLLITPEPITAWEYYCKYNLNKTTQQATTEDYTYYIDCYSGGDEYQDLSNLYTK